MPRSSLVQQIAWGTAKGGALLLAAAVLKVGGQALANRIEAGSETRRQAAWREEQARQDAEILANQVNDARRDRLENGNRSLAVRFYESLWLKTWVVCAFFACSVFVPNLDIVPGLPWLVHQVVVPLSLIVALALPLQKWLRSRLKKRRAAGERSRRR